MDREATTQQAARRTSTATYGANLAFVSALGFASASVPLDYFDSIEKFNEQQIAPEIARSNFITLTGEEIESIDATEFIAQLGRDGSRILDARPSAWFAEAHVVGSINIPESRFATHAERLVGKNERIMVFCGYNESCEIGDAGHGVLSRCKRVAQKLKFIYGYRNAVLVKADIKALALLGVPLSGSKLPTVIATAPHTEAAR